MRFGGGVLARRLLAIRGGPGIDLRLDRLGSDRHHGWARRLGCRPAIVVGGRGGVRLALRFRLIVRRLLTVMAAQLESRVFVDGAGVRLLFSNAEFGEQLQNFVSFDFQLPRQLVDANLLHRKKSAKTTAPLWATVRTAPTAELQGAAPKRRT
jgi:hypothetical protein